MSDKPTKNTAPLQLLLMVAIVLGTIVAGFLMFPDTQQERDELLSELGTTNQGTFLIPPRPLDGLGLESADGEPWRVAEHERKWRLVIPGGAGCRDQCREMVYRTRQVHKLLGRDTGRLERLYLSLDDSLEDETSAYFEKEHPYLDVVYADRSAFATWAENTNLGWQAGTIRALLVDPRGDAMMFYTPEHEGNQILEDLKHLLKYSPD